MKLPEPIPPRPVAPGAEPAIQSRTLARLEGYGPRLYHEVKRYLWARQRGNVKAMTTAANQLEATMTEIDSGVSR